MSVGQGWFEQARHIYGGDDVNALLDRAMRAKGEADLIVFSFLILEELRTIRGCLEGCGNFAPENVAKAQTGKGRR